MSDADGNWPLWAKKAAGVVAVIAAVAVVAAITVATAGTGTVAACIATGALEGAIAGAAIGTVTGAATSAISHRLENGSWEGVGESVLDGAATGALTGSITGALTGGISNGINGVCFVAGTSVLTATGFALIEDISIGDMVWSENPKTGEKELKEVVQTFINETNELVHVYVNGEKIITTPEHPFYVNGKGWIIAGELDIGDMLILQNGNCIPVEELKYETSEISTQVYNFEVDDFHAYYVGINSVLVHNKCIIKENGVKIDVRTSNEHGLPHAHISGNGPNTTIGLDKMPMKNHPSFSRKQLNVIQNNWETIKDGIIKFFPKK